MHSGNILFLALNITNHVCSSVISWSFYNPDSTKRRFVCSLWIIPTALFYSKNNGIMLLLSVFPHTSVQLVKYGSTIKQNNILIVWQSKIYLALFKIKIFLESFFNIWYTMFPTHFLIHYSSQKSKLRYLFSVDSISSYWNSLSFYLQKP